MELAIKGHSTRGREVIELLEMLGGKNSEAYTGYGYYACYFIRNLEIDLDSVYKVNLQDNTICFTLEEFLDKYPYKVGDKVKVCGDNLGVIIGMRWEIDYVVYKVKLSENGYVTSKTSKNLQPYKEETMEGKNNDNWAKWDLPDGYEFQDKEGNVIKTDVIKLVKKQLQYPKTYEECCDVLKIPNDERYIDIDVPLDYNKLLSTFTKLLMCRNAYWKIAGEQMGLGKPWEPDYKNPDIDLYVIINIYNQVKKARYGYGFQHCLFAFPTEEMRDAFLENFKDLIELVKELL